MLTIVFLWIYVFGGLATYEVIYHVEFEGDELSGSRYHHSVPHYGLTKDDAAAIAFTGSLIWPLVLAGVYLLRLINRDNTRHDHR